MPFQLSDFYVGKVVTIAAQPLWGAYHEAHVAVVGFRAEGLGLQALGFGGLGFRV